jgi:drug/metabolite transporter (DMT)-like permease
MITVSHYTATWSLFAFAIPPSLIALFVAGIPDINSLFLPALLITVFTLTISIVIYMKALKVSDLSISLPMLSFTPIFMLISGPLVLGELPAARSFFGIIIIVMGAYLLSIGDLRYGVFAPFKSLLGQSGPRLMLIVAFFWSFTATASKLTVVESSPVFALFSIYCVSTVILTFSFFLFGRLNIHEITGNLKKIAPLGFFLALTDISIYHAFTLTLAVHAIAVKRFNILIGSLYGFTFFKEKYILQRLAGSLLMVVGALDILFSTNI